MTGRHKRDARRLDELAVKATRMYLERGLYPKEIFVELRKDEKDKEDVRSERDVRRLLKRARGKRLVTVRVDAADDTVPTNSRLGRELAAALGIREALVTSTQAWADEYRSPDEEVRQRAFAEGDKLHAQLGQVTAGYLWERIRNRDWIAVGGGRATGFTVEALKALARSEPKNFTGIHIVSLTGTMIVFPWSEKRGNLDADAVAVELAGILKVSREDIDLVHLPVALEAQQREVIDRVAPHLADSPWQHVPDIACFGLGVLNSGHHLVQYRGPQTQAVHDEIDELNKSVLPSVFSAVADICHRFFWIGDENAPPDVRRKAGEIIDSLNRKTVSVTFANLDQSKEKILIAGGAQKYEGLLAFFRRGREEIGLEPTVFVTDEITAQRLLEALRQ